MKALKFEIVLNDDKIVTHFHTKGFSKEKIDDQLIIVGVLENLKSLFKDRIKKLGEVKFE